MTEEQRDLLCRGLTRLGVPYTPEAVERLGLYCRRLLEKNQVMNLTAITDPADVMTLHFLDSAALLPTRALGGRKLIDVGTGAGFPGLVLRILDPTIRLTLLDSLGKRVHWLEEILPQLGVKATCITARAEEAVADRRESYDIATSRAVARLNILLELTAPYVKVGGRVIAMKGMAAREELEECGNAIKKLGLKLEDVREFPVDGTNHALIVLRKVAHTPTAYPRRYAKIKQAPL